MEDFQIVDNFSVIYFVNSTSIYIFATTFISKAKYFYNQTNIYY